jgi:hypothetical protein
VGELLLEGKRPKDESYEPAGDHRGRDLQDGEALRGACGGELELTPFRGHFIFWEGGVHDVEAKKCVSAGVPATDGRAGPVGPQPGRAVAGV